jgi:sugar lactone lactonase YvrE
LGETLVIAAVRKRIDEFWGRGSAAVTVPPMDGALTPNSVLDQAEVALVESGGALFFSGPAGVSLLRGESGAFSSELVEASSEPVASMAGDGSGAIVVARQGVLAIRGGRHDGKSFTQVGASPLLCPTALAFDGPDSIIICLGSAANPAHEWKRDLLQLNASGSVWRLDLASGSGVKLGDGLAWPWGVVKEPAGTFLISESWRHRLLRVGAGSAFQPMLQHLPGYPSRIVSASAGGYWLSVFAPRRQMIEFVLREKAYRERMMREVHPDFWMAPALSSGRSFLEPIQGGQVKHLGLSKPWAPTRSYGLIIRLDRSGLPIGSFHSRADGRLHGIMSCLEHSGRLLATSKGGDAILDIGLRELEGA